MLDPSPASGLVYDPTIRRCEAFARSLNSGRIGVIVICNLFSLIAPVCKVLKSAAMQITRHDNDRFIVDACRGAYRMICARAGCGADEIARRRAREMIELNRMEFSGLLECLGTNLNGSPTHPLYLPADAALEPWRLELYWQASDPP